MTEIPNFHRQQLIKCEEALAADIKSARHDVASAERRLQELLNRQTMLQSVRKEADDAERTAKAAPAASRRSPGGPPHHPKTGATLN